MINVSIITVVLNNRACIEDCIRSVLSQSYPHIEYIVVDGGSTDGTLDIIRKYEDRIARWQSEPDDGIYDAMNKGIRMATGDVIGILNSDDCYANGDIIACAVDCISNNKVESCYGDLVYVNARDANRAVRCWKSGGYKRDNFKKGWMPPHPTFFVRRYLYEKYGLFNLTFPLAADYELMLRMLYKNNVSTAYTNRCMVKMRTGGRNHPGILNTFNNMLSDYRAWRVNGLTPNPLTFLMKPFFKLPQYVKTAPK